MHMWYLTLLWDVDFVRLPPCDELCLAEIVWVYKILIHIMIRTFSPKFGRFIDMREKRWGSTPRNDTGKKLGPMGLNGYQI